MKGPDRKRLEKLFSMLGSDNAGESENARSILKEILHKHRMTWNDLLELLKTPATDDNSETAAPPDREPDGTNISILDLVHALLEQYLELQPHEYVAMALWVLHTHIYQQFLITPRLALTSPVRGCGKTTVLGLLALLTARARKSDGITAAAIFRLIDSERCTLLIDEADNMGLDRDGILRAVINSGHRRGGSHTRVINNEVREFATFAPLALAAIGMLPLPIMHRSVVIHMERATRGLRRFDENDRAVDLAFTKVREWARDAQLNYDPEVPKELRNRPADNWRPLIAIADDFGSEWGERARKAAKHFSHSQHDEDLQVVLLDDIRTVFNERGVDWLFSEVLVNALVDMDDSPWADWKGLRDDRQPRHLTQAELARLLKGFRIHPKAIWPQQRKEGAKSKKGYRKEWFKAAWAAYCDEGVTPSQPSQPGRLRRN